MDRPSSSPSTALGWLRAALALPCLIALAACGGDDNDEPPARRLQFHPAEMVTAAPVLTGDASSGRCADASAPCFANNSDFLNGQRRMLRIEDIAVGARTRNSSDSLDFFVGGIATTATSVVTSVKGSSLQGQALKFKASAPVVLGARLFDGAQDVLVSALAGGSLSVTVDTKDARITGGNGRGVPAGNVTEPVLRAAKADLTGDGLDEVVFATSSDQPTLQVMSAANSADPAAGLQFGDPIVVNRMLAVAVGNFFGDGPVVAILVAQIDASLLLQYYAVNPSLGLAPLPAKTLTLQRPAGALITVSASIAVGRFNTVAYDQMLIAVTDFLRTDLLSVDTDANALPVQRLRAVSDSSPLVYGLLRAGRFDWSSPFDSVAYLVTYENYDSRITSGRLLSVLTLDANLAVGAQTASLSFTGAQCIYDMQVGNFDRRVPDPTPSAPPGATIHNPNLQIAVVTSSATNDDGDPCSGGTADGKKGLTFQVYDVEPGAAGGLSFGAQNTYLWSSFTQAPLNKVALAVPDLQGRSLVLGEPKVLVIESNQQATVVLAAPPMHADFIGGKLVNFSAAPNGFFAGYSWSSSSDSKATNKSTTTWSWGAEESLETKVQAGDCDVGDCGSIDNKVSAKQALDGSTATLQGTLASHSVEFTQQTGLHDQLWYSDSALTVYIYPVLGRTVCPSSTPNCAAADKVPMTVMFAGPDSVRTTATDSSQIAWYQPPWMPGNALSYPGTVEQLRAAAYPGAPQTFGSLTQDLRWSTGDGSATEQASWSGGSTSGTTVSFNQNYSFNDTLTISGSWGVPAAFTTSATAQFSLSGSFGFQKLTTSVVNMSQSTGIAFTKQAQFADPGSYSYWVTPMVFGQIPPPSVQAPPPVGDLTTFGSLRTGYVVDPLADGAGGIWRSTDYTAAPDVAFNQPQRWTVTLSVTDRADGSCLLFDRGSTNVDCVSLTTPAPGDPFNDEYHHLRGFFITGAEAGGSGPQLGSATAGDKLLLQTRVHNFSMAAMPAGAIVRVRFYGMVWDSSNNTPIGKSFVIGTATSPQGGVPPFNNSSSTPNWVLVGTPFDTTGYDDKDLVFWAVTWIEDASGALLAELAGKGLTAIPDAGLDFAGVAALEQPHGNNLGLYREVFHVFNAPGSAAPPAAVAATRPSAVIQHVGSDATVVARGDKVTLAARVRTGENALRGGLSVHFVDGDPRQGGQVVGVQTLRHLRADSDHEFHVGFRPRSCGRRDIYVVAGPGTRFEHIARLGGIEVRCS